MSEIKGRIEWLPPAPNEYPKNSGEFNIGIKVKSEFYNLYKPKEKLESLLKRLKLGFEVKLTVEGNEITNLEVTNDKVESKPGSFRENLERVNYKTLTDQAHKIGMVSMKVEHVPELTDVSKKTACFKATVIICKEVDGKKVYQRFEDFGDACGLPAKDGGNIDQESIRNAWIRMASTRAQVRALKQATNNMEVAEEEMPNGTIENDAGQKKKTN